MMVGLYSLTGSKVADLDVSAPTVAVVVYGAVPYYAQPDGTFRSSLAAAQPFVTPANGFRWEKNEDGF